MDPAARLACIDWHYPKVASGQLDPLAFSAPIALTANAFALADRVFIPPVAAELEAS
jgi:hypothetical protein